jgi:ribonuclease D
MRALQPERRARSAPSGIDLTHWIDRTDALSDFAARAKDDIGLDTEFMRISTFFPKLALIQAILGEEIALIDPTGAIELDPLGEILADPARTIVMHSASEDLEALATRFARGIGRLYDTQIAAAFAGLGTGIGYQKLVRDVLGIELPKAETRSDWLRRPLTPQQREYAEHDVAHLPALHALLGERVERRGYAAWLAEDCARMLERARRRESDPEPQLAFRGAADWPRERQALLRRVLRWRDASARRTDTPRPWILEDAAALDLALAPPRDASDLAERTKGLRGLRSALRAELFETLARPLADEDLDIEPIPRAPSPREKPVLSALKETVAKLAAELDLPETLLCTRRSLETLLITRRWPRALEGWRREVLHDALVARLPDDGASATNPASAAT